MVDNKHLQVGWVEIFLSVSHWAFVSLLYSLVSDYLILEWTFIPRKLPPDCACTVSSLNVTRCVERSFAALVSVEAPGRACSLSRDAIRNQAIRAVLADEDPNSSLMIFECTSAR